MYEFRPLNIAISSSSHSDFNDNERMLTKGLIRVVWPNPFSLQRQRSKSVTIDLRLPYDRYTLYYTVMGARYTRYRYIRRP